MTGAGVLRSQAQIPRGVFSLKGAGGNALLGALTNPDVVGLSVRQDWSDLEPNEGEFDFTYLDSQVQAAATNNKVVLLRINTQANKPAWVTQAIQDAGGIFFTFDNDGVPTTIPVFWDPTYLSKKKSMIAALGTHFAANSTVKIVAASFANAVSEDWDVPHEQVDVTNWIADGYTTEKLLDAGQQIIDATMVAFPNQYVTLAIGGDGYSKAAQNLDDSATEVAATTVSMSRSKWPGRLIVQINSLSTFNPVAPGLDDSAWNVLWNSQPDVGAQMLASVYNDFTYRVNNGVPGDFGAILNASIDSAVTYGINYVEIYELDVRNLKDSITYAREKLTATPTPTPTPTPAPPVLTGAVSRLHHAGIGDFDITMPITGVSGVEDRQASTYNIVLSFDNGPMTSGTATVTAGIGTAGVPSFSGNTMTVPLTGVTDAEVLTLTVSNLNGQTASASINLGFLVGDLNADRITDTTDYNLARGMSGQTVGGGNFTVDVNLDGSINVGDSVIVRAKSGHSIP